MALEAEGSNPSTHPNPLSGAGRGFFNILGCRQAVKAQDFDSCIRGFESRQPSDYSSQISEKQESGCFCYKEKNMQILGFNFKSKAERERDEKKYKDRIFPGGEEEREKVCRELKKRLPGQDEKDLLLCYVHFRDQMTGAELSFEQVEEDAKESQWLSFADQKIFDAIREVMELVRTESSENISKN